VWRQFDWLEPGDDRVEPERLHVSLVLLAAAPRISQHLIERARSACASVTAASFRVVFDDVIVNDGVLLKPTETLAAFDRFQEQLVNALADSGLVSRKRPASGPHMTTSYRTRTRSRPFVPPVSWEVRDFVLVESLVGQRRHIDHGRWPLQSRGQLSRQ
jgi:2'-5' RNA ligase